MAREKLIGAFMSKANGGAFSSLAIYIILSGWAGFAIYILLSFEAEEGVRLLGFFLSPEHSGIRFRALAFFAPLVLTVIGFLVNEREKLFRATLDTKRQLDALNDHLMSYNERLSTLHSIELSISSSLDLREVLRSLTEKVVSQFSLDAAAVLLLTPDRQALKYAAGAGFRTDRIRTINLRAGESYAGAAVREGRKILIPDVEASDYEYYTDGNYKFTESELFIAEGFEAYYALPLRMKGNTIGVLEVFQRRAVELEEGMIEFFEALATQAAIAIENAQLFDTLQHTHSELVDAYDTTIEGWSRALDASEKETEGHSRRVTTLTLRVARRMGLGEEEMVHVRRGSLLHDIGLMGVPDRIIFKDAALDPEERAVMQRHPRIAFDILGEIRFLAPALDIPYCHHERWDGSGYPRALRGREIPLAARIFAVVDVWDSLMNDRPFRKAWPEDRVRHYIVTQAGSEFDPEVVDVFLEVLSTPPQQAR